MRTTSSCLEAVSVAWLLIAVPGSEARITIWLLPVELAPGKNATEATPELSVVATAGSMRPLLGSAWAAKLTIEPFTGLSAASRTTAISWLELVPLLERFTPMLAGLAWSVILAGVRLTNSTRCWLERLPATAVMVEMPAVEAVMVVVARPLASVAAVAGVTVPRVARKLTL